MGKYGRIKEHLFADAEPIAAEDQIMPCRNARCAGASPKSPCSCSACNGALHNPPARRARKSKRTRSAAARSQRTRSSGCGRACKCGKCESCAVAARSKVSVVHLGAAVSLVYRDARGKLWKHDFESRGTKVYRTHDGRQLIVAPVRIQEFVI